MLPERKGSLGKALGVGHPWQPSSVSSQGLRQGPPEVCAFPPPLCPPSKRKLSEAVSKSVLLRKDRYTRRLPLVLLVPRDFLSESGGGSWGRGPCPVAGGEWELRPFPKQPRRRCLGMIAEEAQAAHPPGPRVTVPVRLAPRGRRGVFLRVARAGCGWRGTSLPAMKVGVW